MSDIICITNRKLCKGDFVERIKAVAETKPKAIILREKDLDENEYTMLAEKIMLVCAKYYVPCILHSFSGAAIRLNADAVHLPLPLLRKMTEREKASFKHIGTSCHSLAEAEEAETLGCTYLITGHIFDTDCKRNIPSRGLAFLSEICSKAKIPVYAIGGINRLNISSVTEAGAAGACVMSGLMGCENVRLYMEELKSG